MIAGGKLSEQKPEGLDYAMIGGDKHCSSTGSDMRVLGRPVSSLGCPMMGRVQIYS